MEENREERKKVRLEELKKLRGGGFPFWAVLSLILALVLVFFFHNILSRKAVLPKSIPAPVNAGSNILGETYYNYVYGFQISLPTKDWRFKILNDTSPLSETVKDEKRSYLAQKQLLLRLDLLDRDRYLAWVEVGVVPLPGPRSAETVARESYMETVVEDSYRNITTETLLNPTTYSSGPLKSGYYVVSTPAHAPFDTQAVVFVVKDLKAVVIVAKVQRKDYDTYKWDLEKIFNSFNYIGK